MVREELHGPQDRAEDSSNPTLGRATGTLSHTVSLPQKAHPHLPFMANRVDSKDTQGWLPSPGITRAQCSSLTKRSLAQWESQPRRTSRSSPFL